MAKSWQQLREDAWAIWRAGVSAVNSRQLVRQHLRGEPQAVWVDEHRLPLTPQSRLVVVGAGKAGAGMAEGLLEALGEELCQRTQLTGWVNVPEDCVRPLPRIHLHGARPRGVNEPTRSGVEGSEKILQLVRSLTLQDGCFVLLSGGASALLPAPVPEVPLEEKLALTRHLSAAGANIQQLNTVRKQLSRIKGGRLAAQCRAGWMVTLIISDVLGDPLDIIGSGPTVHDTSTAEQALAILEQFHASQLAPKAVEYLRRQMQRPTQVHSLPPRLLNLVIANNATAVEAAGVEADRRGYPFALIAADRPEGPAEQVGVQLAEAAMTMKRTTVTNALISGGEPIVRLAPPEIRGRGGRNQQLVLAAFCHLLQHIAHSAAGGKRSEPPSACYESNPCQGLIVLSGGTDGEDGPTDAAGAWIDEQVYRVWRQRHLDPWDHLRRNDAYSFFHAVGGLFVTGPTDTNVCDLRVVLASS